MCWGLAVYDGDRHVTTVETVAQAAKFFGAQHLRFTDSREKVNAQAEHCLCPIDVDHLVAANGYRFVSQDHPHWDCFDDAIEKVPA